MNLHTHTNYCDGKNEPIAYIQQALELNWDIVGFSAHAPLPFKSPWTIRENLIDSYLIELNALRTHFKSEINIAIGWEIDYLEGKGFFALEDERISQADFLICSIHYLSNPKPDDKIAGYLEIDGDFNVFQGLLKLYNGDLKALLNNYLTSLDSCLSINNPKIKIIGHLDKIIINAEKTSLFKPLRNWFYMSIIFILEKHKKKSQKNIIEINTRSIYHLNRSIPYPSLEILQYLHEVQSPCIISSDSHHPSELNLGFLECRNLIIKNGLKLNFVNHEIESFLNTNSKIEFKNAGNTEKIFPAFF